MTPPTDSRVQDVFDLSSEFVDQMAALRPMTATYQGIPGHDHKWDDLSPAGGERVRAFLVDYETRLRAFPRPTERWARLATDVMAEHLKDERNWFDDGDDVLDLNNIASTFQSLRQVFDITNTSSASNWEDIAARLETIDRAIAGYRETLERGRQKRSTVAVRQVRAAIEQGRTNAGPDSFFRRLIQGYERAAVGNDALRKRLEAAIPKACTAFGEFADWLERTYLPDATPKDAVGRERYARQTRRFLGMKIDPEETYAWGWDQVRSIERQMREVANTIRPGASMEEVFTLLKSDPSRAAKDREEFVRLMTERQYRALGELDGVHFDIPNEIKKVEVKIAPAGGALGAYYIQPSEDFSRPGTVWYSLAPSEQTNIPIYDHISTAYHEGFPGHHLQCGIQVALAGQLSRLHRLSVWYPGYGEGWALYTEHLMNELGYFEKPEYVLGMLNAQMFRACRVVIDIGSHLELKIPAEEKMFHPGETWNFHLGVEMMMKRAFQDAEYAASEVTRYLGWPGQAISYKVGERAIMELHDEVRRRQGSAFDLKRFHMNVLGSGPVGLDLLRELVLAD
ncbi:MAG: DUF885 domain-containing protein [Candidatus Eiseniibacteriota bacterium]